jgi:hypothetical protein
MLLYYLFTNAPAWAIRRSRNIGHGRLFGIESPPDCGCHVPHLCANKLVPSELEGASN